MSQLSLTDISVRYDDIQALREIDFSVEEGEFFCIVGPTNAGKSTLLKTIAGLIRPDSGTVVIKDRNVTHFQPKDRNISLLFQNIALFPTLTGFENMAFPLKISGASEQEIRKRVMELAEMLKVEHILNRLPKTFSGGEQQRVAIGRSIAKPADLLMLDEPLTNLDARIRIALRLEFKEIHKKLGQTVIYVTHDQVEAMSMSDRIAVLHEGRLQQIGSPDEIYNRPANKFVAEFIGQPSMNILAAKPKITDGATIIEIGTLNFPLDEQKEYPAKRQLPENLALGIRPEAVRLSTSKSKETPNKAKINRVEYLGGMSIVQLQLGQEILRAKIVPDDPVNLKNTVWFGFELVPEQLLDLETEKFI